MEVECLLFRAEFPFVGKFDVRVSCCLLVGRKDFMFGMCMVTFPLHE